MRKRKIGALLLVGCMVAATLTGCGQTEHANTLSYDEIVDQNLSADDDDYISSTTNGEYSSNSIGESGTVDYSNVTDEDVISIIEESSGIVVEEGISRDQALATDSIENQQLQLDSFSVMFNVLSNYYTPDTTMVEDDIIATFGLSKDNYSEVFATTLSTDSSVTFCAVSTSKVDAIVNTFKAYMNSHSDNAIISNALIVTNKTTGTDESFVYFIAVDFTNKEDATTDLGEEYTFIRDNGNGTYTYIGLDDAGEEVEYIYNVPDVNADMKTTFSTSFTEMGYTIN